MHKIHRALILIIWVVLPGKSAWAGTADEHYLLSSSQVTRLKTVNVALSKIEFDDDTAADKNIGRKNGKLMVEYYVRSIEGKPQVVNIIGKSGFTPSEFGLASYALMHAVMFLHVERTSNKKSAVGLLDGLTKEQKANVSLLRKLGPSAY